MQSITSSVQLLHMLPPFLKLPLLPIFLMRKLKLRKVNDLLQITELGIKPRSLRLQSYMHIKSMNTSLIKIISTSTTITITLFYHIWKDDFPSINSLDTHNNPIRE